MKLTNEQVIYLNNLYKSLINYRTDLIKKRQDRNVSSEDYFKHGIEYDIIENALSIVVNILIDNIESVGVDNNSRSILEAFSILELDKIGYITPLRKQIYRVMYAGVEYSNLSEEIDKPNKRSHRDKQRQVDYKELTRLLRRLFGLAEDAPIGEKILQSPYSYLASKAKNQYIKLTDILKKQNIDINSGFNADLHSFFSILIHPRFGKGLEETRKDYIFEILKKVASFLDDLGPVPDTNPGAVIDRSHRNLYLDNYVSMTKQICKDYISFYGGKTDSTYHNYYINQMSYLLVDMLVCERFGYKDMVVIKYKSFCEMTAMFAHFHHLRTINEYCCETETFKLSTNIQAYNALGLPWELTDSGKTKIDNIFNSYYKDKYKLENTEQLLEGLKTNLFYFYSNDRTARIKSIVEEELKTFTRNTKGYNRVLSGYNTSLDLDHASGYLYNQTPILNHELCYHSMIDAYSMLNYFRKRILRSKSKKQSNRSKLNWYTMNIVVILFVLLLRSHITKHKDCSQ